jgi:acetyl esterase
MASGYGLTTQAMKWFWEQYLQGTQHDNNPYAVPMTADDFFQCAPAIIITAQYDPLLSDGEKYASLLQRDGVPVLYRQFGGMIHGFFTNMAVTPTAQVAIDFLAEELKKLVK